MERLFGLLDHDKKRKQKVRLISISSCFGKLLERIVNNRLNWWVEKKGILDSKQNGFRKGRSSNGDILELTTDVKLDVRKEEDFGSFSGCVCSI